MYSIQQITDGKSRIFKYFKNATAYAESFTFTFTFNVQRFIMLWFFFCRTYLVVVVDLNSPVFHLKLELAIRVSSRLDSHYQDSIASFNALFYSETVIESKVLFNVQFSFLFKLLVGSRCGCS